MIGVLSALALLLAGCGAGDDDIAEEAEPEEETVEEEAPEEDVDPAEDGEEEADEEPDEPAPDEEIAEYFREQGITFVISFGTGGGHDAMGRQLAPLLAEELDASLVIENQEGAGGMVANNNLMRADPDGTTVLFTFGETLVSNYMIDAEGMRYDLEEMAFLGRLTSEPYMLVVNADSPYETVEDVRGAEGFRFAVAGFGGGKHLNSLVFLQVLDIDGEAITGYDSAAEEELALLRGDVDAIAVPLGAILPRIEAGEARALVATAFDRSSVLPEVPTLLEVEGLTDEQAAIVEAHTQLFTMGRVLMGPPGMSQDTIEFLREAVGAAIQRPDLAEWMESTGREVDYLDGEGLEQQAMDLLRTATAEYVEILLVEEDG